jgi:hypothetical protein
LKRDGAAVETSDAFEVVTLASVVGKRGFATPEAAASSANSNGFACTKVDKEEANGLGEAAGVISFSVVAAGLGKANGEVVAGAPTFSIIAFGLGKLKGDAGAPTFSVVSAGLWKANGEGIGGVSSLATSVTPGFEKSIAGAVDASAGFGKAKGEGEAAGLAANGFTGAASAGLPA